MNLGRWVYCKYCYKSVRPQLGPDGSVVVCSECEHGLRPVLPDSAYDEITDVILAASERLEREGDTWTGK